MIISEIKRNSDLSMTLSVSDAEGRREAEIVAATLTKLLNRFNEDLNNYFRMIDHPSADEVSSMSQIQLEAEQNLIQLEVKLRSQEKSHSSLGSEIVSSRLPKLHLPEFEGDILQWHQFWDQFCSNIDSRNIADVDKLLYLQASVKGKAKESIEGFDITGKNYQIAVKTLQERYGSSVHLIDAHYAALAKVKPAEKSVSSCRTTLNNIEKHLRVLESLKEDVNHSHLRYLIFEKLPEDLIYELKLKTTSNSIKDIRRHLELIITAREDASRIANEGNPKNEYTVESLHVTQEDKKSGDTSTTNKHQVDETKYKPKTKNTRHQAARDSSFRKRGHSKREDHKKNIEKITRGPQNKRRKIACIFCGEDHFNDQCPKDKNIEERKQKLKNRCFRCFREGHSIRACKYQKKCFYCSKNDHNRALCPTKFSTSRKSEVTMTTVGSRGSTALQTAIVYVKKIGSSNEGKYRILFDSGSQRSYITKSAASMLDLETEQEDNLTVFTFGSKAPHEFVSSVVKMGLKTRHEGTKEIYANVVPTITKGVPYPREELSQWKSKELLADDGSLQDQVDILIGNDYYFSLMTTERKQLKDNLYLVKSKFGWILSGKLETKPTETLSVLTYFQSSMETKLDPPDLPIDQGNISFLWELESIGINDSPKANREEEAVDNFNKTTSIIEGRYTVAWPWKEYPPALQSNYGLAYGRLVSLVKRLDKETLKTYNETLQDQVKNGIIEIIQTPTIPEDHPIHYLPHHCVAQKGKPIRIVYDASAKSGEGKSLNQCLYCGPLMLEDLTGLLIRFRHHRIAISADVEKAFLQIALHEADRDVTRFLWIKDISKLVTKNNLQCMRFCRVPFGIISSPFILNAAIKHHLNKSQLQLIKEMADDIYVDNLITGTSTIEEAVELYRATKDTFQQISMNIRDWCSNSKQFMRQIPDTNKVSSAKILGLKWNLEQDTLELKFDVNTEANNKRGVLKVIASIYDPCGFATPHILPAKLFLQDLWKQKYKWDEIFSEQLHDKWSDIRKELEEIHKIFIPRCYVTDTEKYQLHCFTDASLKAYAAAVYIVNEENIHFIIGKSRLVPIKDQDNLKIPRLELLGVLIGSRLIKFVMKQLKIKLNSQTLWTDSKIVIEWHRSNKLLPPFVSRRIEEIKKNKELIVRYVPSELNPADVATRPPTLDKDRELWQKGPDFLLEEPKWWPANRGEETLSFPTCGEGPTNGERTELFKKREVKSITKLKEIDNKDIPSDRIEQIKRLQKECFPLEVQEIETDLSRNLRLFKDIDGILRCEGRMKNADWSFDKRYPILIPRECDFTNNIIKTTHEENYHVGANHTLSLIRQNYWIPQGKAQVLKIIKKCPRCVKHGGGPFKLPPTPALPAERVNYSAPFTFTGIDYMGPLLVNKKGPNKRWICLFTCLAVRAIHLEVVKDLSAEEGLLALRRFIATRGVPTLITSDNALYFKLIAEIVSKEYCVKEKIRWKFIPQLAPWFGGFYERLVGIVKNCMKRTLQKHLLNDSQLATVMKEIEAVINTRPLTCVDSELDQILKPADFLTLGKCITMETSNTNEEIIGTVTKTELVKVWRKAIIMTEEFKEMFTNRYLPSLRERYRHSHKEPRSTVKAEPKIGQVVQIKGETKNREGWKVGKISSLLRGADGLCRVAKIKIGEKEFTRSIAHIYPLEMEENDITEYEANNTCDDAKKALEMVWEEHPLLEKYPDETPIETPVEIINHDSINMREEGSEDTQMNDRSEKQSDSDTPDEVPNSKEETKPRRSAATRALEKIKEWTRNLLTIL